MNVSNILFIIVVGTSSFIFIFLHSSIIVDRSSNFNLYKKILEYNNIPVAIKKDQTLTTGYDIMVLRNLLNIVIKVNKEEYDRKLDDRADKNNYRTM